MSTAVARITVAEVDASIARVIEHAESIWDEWAWQVENQTWLIKGYGSWDEMRRAVYGNLSSITAPRAERPELVARFRGAGLTQRETAETLGVTEQTVYNDQRKERDPKYLGKPDPTTEPDVVIDAEAIEDTPTHVNRQTGEVLDGPAPAPDHEWMTELINDLRGPWRTGLTRAARTMTPAARARVIEALQNTLNDLNEMENSS